VDRLRAKGLLKSVKAGNTVRFDPNDVDEYIENLKDSIFRDLVDLDLVIALVPDEDEERTVLVECDLWDRVCELSRCGEYDCVLKNTPVSYLKHIMSYWLGHESSAGIVAAIEATGGSDLAVVAEVFKSSETVYVERHVRGAEKVYGLTNRT
jgi:hypothetical protein